MMGPTYQATPESQGNAKPGGASQNGERPPAVSNQGPAMHTALVVVVIIAIVVITLLTITAIWNGPPPV